MKGVDMANIDKPFGGKTIIFGGDFRQILPVIPKGSHNDIVSATISRSYIWKHCEVLRLTKNMRLQSLGENDETVALSQFAKWIAGIGDGKIGNCENGVFKVEIPNHMLTENDGYLLASIIDTIYPELDDGPTDPSYLKERDIMAPTLDLVDSVNHYMIEKTSGECRTYYSSNSACSSDSCSYILADVHTPEFFSAVKCSGVPNRELKLKVGASVMLLRNIDPGMGLCNGTRLLITRLESHVLEGRIITGTNSGERVIIPRLSLTRI
ncbi:hypothetical protein CASFOL_028163 [Castilleja foliolosa]|uniref:ATP-dependent DNA helicase n=1 Tax=Castilleja foliolosa TaxID=1961234 RepID=A0ABD3CGA6_9LAMI